MKKLFLIFALFLFSCEKEKAQPPAPVCKSCVEYMTTRVIGGQSHGNTSSISRSYGYFCDDELKQQHGKTWTSTYTCCNPPEQYITEHSVICQ